MLCIIYVSVKQYNLRRIASTVAARLCPFLPVAAGAACLDGLSYWRCFYCQRFLPMLIESPLLASDYCLPMNLNTLLAIGSSAYFNKIVDIGIISSWCTI